MSSRGRGAAFGKWAWSATALAAALVVSGCGDRNADPHQEGTLTRWRAALARMDSGSRTALELEKLANRDAQARALAGVSSEPVVNPGDRIDLNRRYVPRQSGDEWRVYDQNTGEAVTEQGAGMNQQAAEDAAMGLNDNPSGTSEGGARPTPNQ